MQKTKHYKADAGENISETAKAMTAMAKEHQCRVTSTFNNIGLIAGPTSSADEITKFYSEECARRSAAYEASPAGAESRRKQAEFDKQAAAAESEGFLPFDVNDAEKWKVCMEKNSDPYGAATLRYAARWANYMEREMVAGKKIAKIAGPTSHEADKEGITGFMYGCAVSILASLWKHGEALRLWHNLKTQIGDEGEKANESGGTLNPACLVVGEKSP